MNNYLYFLGVDAYLCISSYPPKSLSKYPPLPQVHNKSNVAKFTLL